LIFNETELTLALNELKNAAFDETLIYDEELAIASIAKLTTMTLTKKSKSRLKFETLNKINATYSSMKDGKVFSRFRAESEETG